MKSGVMIDGDGQSIMNLIEMTAAEIESQEHMLRDIIIQLVTDRQYEEAISVLRDWNEMSPGEVLDRHRNIMDNHARRRH